MALSTSYVLRETGGNIKRNFHMSLAAILTMALALIAFGAVRVMDQAVKKAQVMTEGNVQVAVFLDPHANLSQIAAIKAELSNAPTVKTFHYVDKTQAYDEFKTIFGSNNELVSVLTPNDMPTSFRVVPTTTQDVDELGRQFANQPGVLRVSYPKQAIEALNNQFHKWEFIGYILSPVVLVVSVVLIVNTIQLAIFARRREIAVMKLVGATNWFIRVPFMMEGLFQGIVGAVAAAAAVYSLRNWLPSVLPEQSLFGSYHPLYVTTKEGILTGIVLLVLGAAVGAIGSAFAAGRYLAV